LSEIETMAEQLNNLNGTIQKSAGIFDRHSIRGVQYSTPHTFNKLELVEMEMKLVKKWKLEMEDMLKQSKDIQPILKPKLKGLESKMIELLKFRQTVNFSKGDYRYQKAISSLINTDCSIGVIEMYIDLDGIEAVANKLEKARSALSWVQLRALEHIELLKQYDQLIENMPAELENSNPLFANLEELKKNISLVGESVGWALRKEKEYRRLHYVDSDKTPKHNGYGVDAWKPYSEAKSTWGNIKLDLSKTAVIAEKWTQDVGALRKQISTQLQEMDKGGWIVEDIKRALYDSLAIPVKGLGTDKYLKNEGIQLQGSMDSLDKGFKWSIVPALAPIDKAWKDAVAYKVFLRKALTAARNGNLKGSETALAGATGLIPYEASISTSRSNVNHREVLLDKESYEMEMELNNLLFILKRDQYKSTLAHLTIEVAGGSFSDLSVLVLDNGNNRQSDWNGNSCTLEPGTYRVQCSSMGNRVNPAEQEITLAKGENKTIQITIKKPIDPGQNTSGTGIVGNYNFNNIKIRVFAYDVCPSIGHPPAWSTDSKIVVSEGQGTGCEGLVAFDLEKNKSWQVTTKKPLPPARYKDSTISSSFPKVIGDSVVHKMNIEYQWAPGSWSRERYWMVVPLNGGQSSPIEKELPEFYKIVDIRQKNGELEYLLFGEINDKIGIFLLKTGSADYKDATLLHQLNEWYSRFFVSPDWKLICLGDADYKKGYNIYKLGGKKLSHLPQSHLHTFTFSPDNKFIAGQQRLDKAPWNQIVVFPINDISNINVVDSGAIRYDQLAWSPNGRYLAYQRASENEDGEGSAIEFVVADLTAKGSSLAEGGAITKPK